MKLIVSQIVGQVGKLVMTSGAVFLLLSCGKAIDREPLKKSGDSDVSGLFEDPVPIEEDDPQKPDEGQGDPAPQAKKIADFITFETAQRHALGNEETISPVYAFIREDVRSDSMNSSEAFFHDYLFELTHQSLQGLRFLDPATEQWNVFPGIKEHQDCSPFAEQVETSFSRSYLSESRGLNSSLSFFMMRLHSHQLLQGLSLKVEGESSADVWEAVLVCAQHQDTAGTLSDHDKAALGWLLEKEGKGARLEGLRQKIDIEDILNDLFEDFDSDWLAIILALFL